MLKTFMLTALLCVLPFTLGSAKDDRRIKLDEFRNKFIQKLEQQGTVKPKDFFIGSPTIKYKEEGMKMSALRERILRGDFKPRRFVSHDTPGDVNTHYDHDGTYAFSWPWAHIADGCENWGTCSATIPSNQNKISELLITLTGSNELERDIPIL